MKISYQHNASFRGYMACGVENTAGKVDLREQVEYAREYNHTTTTTTNDKEKKKKKKKNDHDDNDDEEPFYKRLCHAPNPWPSDDVQPTLRPAILAHVDLLLDVSLQLRRAFCLSLLYPSEKVQLAAKATSSSSSSSSTTTITADDDESTVDLLLQQLQQRLDEDFFDPHWVVKLIAYSSSSEQQQESAKGDNDSNINNNDTDSSSQHQQQGVGAHTDTNFMTLVLQDDVGGLQVFLNDAWINVPTKIEGSDSNNGSSNQDNNDLMLVCNLGESAQLYSGGYFCATPHRVVIQQHQQQQQQRRRISVPFFYNPSLDTIVQPLLDLPTDLNWNQRNHNRPQQEAKWRPSSNTMLASVGENTFKSLARSHPQVFRQHHADLEVLPTGRIVRRRRKEEQQQGMMNTDTIIE